MAQPKMTIEEWLALPAHKNHTLSKTGFKWQCERCCIVFGRDYKPKQASPRSGRARPSIYQEWYGVEPYREKERHWKVGTEVSTKAVPTKGEKR